MGGWSIALHGGAGDIPLNLPPHLKERRQDSLAGLQHCLDVGVAALNAGRSALDVVELVVRELENHPRFNAGRGSVLTTAGTVEMEASIMDGLTKNCGAVSGLKTVANPVSLARLVMEKSPHVYLGFDGAEAFAREQGVETLEPSQFITPENIERLRIAKEANKVQLDYATPEIKQVLQETHTADEDVDSKLGTVGCVALDSEGNLAAATSTGGLVNKRVGRIGDTPILGSGNYANSYCAVSATGLGEYIIRGTIAREVAALMEYKDMSLKEAAAYVIDNCAPPGSVGIIAVSPKGDIAMPFNTTGMYRACATQDGYSEISIH